MVNFFLLLKNNLNAIYNLKLILVKIYSIRDFIFLSKSKLIY